MFRPVFSRSNIPQRIPPYPSDPVFEVVKTKTFNGGTSQVENETFSLDTGIYEITITTPLKSNVNRIIAGDSIENSSALGRIKQVQYNVSKMSCYAHYCNDYIELNDTNNVYPHLDPKTSVTQTGTFFSGYGEYYIVRTKYGIDSKQAIPTTPPVQTRLPSIAGMIAANTETITIGGSSTPQAYNWHILAGYNANTIPIDMQKSFYSTKEVVQV